MRLKAAHVLFVALLAPATGTVHSSGPDLHRMWDDRCAPCHGHSAEFARRHLNVTAADELKGSRAGPELRRFLANHHLADSEVDAVYEMLRAQAATPARFQSECSACHGTAAELVRQSLKIRDGTVQLRGSGEPLAVFLRRHRDLNPSDAAFFTGVLARIAREVNRP